MPLKILKKVEGGETEESSTVEESSTTEESNITEESSATEESGKTEESGGTEESSTVEESSATGESGKTEESSATEESSTVEESSDMDDSPYPDDERTDLSSIAAVAAIKDKIYDGEAYEPVLKVTATVGGKKTTLTEGADYCVLYEQGQKSADVGEHTVTIRGNGEYKGQVVKTFTIKPKSIKKIKIITGGIVGTTDLDTLPLCVYDGVKRLQLGTDYTLSDYRTTKPTAAEALVKGVGNYEGTVKAKFTIYESGTQFIAPACVTLTDDAAAYAYTGKAVKSQVTVIVNGTTLTNKDYKVQYQNNKNAGTAYVIVTGKGVYKGNVVLPFTIRTETVEKPNDFSIEEIKAKTYNGKLQKPAVSVTIQKNGKTKKLSKKDYKVTYKDNFHAGEATIIVTGKGNYAGLSATAKFIIQPQQIKKVSLKGTQGALVLTYSKRKLREGTDYEQPKYGTITKNKVVVTIKGKGDFTGEMTKNVKVQ